MQQAILGLFAETSIHPGTGKSAGVIDLPIMREAHSGWPCVFGSAMKGSLRARAEQQPASKDWIQDVFGPDTANAGDHAGALTVGDARLLLLPVRSLTSHFKWVTCPALLARASDDAVRTGLAPAPRRLPMLDGNAALIAGKDTELYLEEFHFATRTFDLSDLIHWLAPFLGCEEAESRLADQLVIVSNDLFAHLAQYATPVTPHIAIESKTKTTKDGALWYEETLPESTVLYVILGASRSRRGDSSLESADILGHALSLFPESSPYLQVGGNETTGMGWCRVARVGG